jgi:hypothetical protein
VDNIYLEWQRLRKVERALTKIKAISVRPGEWPGVGVAVVVSEQRNNNMSNEEVIAAWQEAFDNVPGKHMPYPVKRVHNKGFAWEDYIKSKVNLEEFENEFYPNWVLKEGE